MRFARRVPFVSQHANTECGLACMAMVLSALGRRTTLMEMRKLCPPGRDGTSVGSLIRLAETFGVKAKALATHEADLSRCSFPLIAHWRLNHWIVIESATATQITAVDPKLGRRIIHQEEWSEYFSGVVIAFKPSEEFQCETESNKSATWALLGELFRDIHGWQLLVPIIYTSLILQALSLTSPILIRQIVDYILPHRLLGVMPLITTCAVVAVITFVLTSMVRQFTLLRMRLSFDDAAQVELVGRLLAKDLPFVQTYTGGDLLGRLTGFSNIRQFAGEQLISMLFDAVLFVGYIVWLGVLNVRLALVALLFVSIQVLALALTAVRQGSLANDVYTSAAEESSFLLDMLDGFAYVKASGCEREAWKKWKSLFRAELRASGRRSYLNIALGLVTSGSGMAGGLALLILGTRFVQQGSLTAGAMLAAAAMAVAIFSSSQNIISVGIQFHWTRTLVERLEDIIENSSSVKQPAGRHLLKGSVACEHVTFHYPGSIHTVISDVSLRIKPGERVAIVGPTGSGKTTLVWLILGVVSPSAGDVFYDEISLSKLLPTDIRKQIGVVLQEPQFFSGSIRENLEFGLDDVTLPKIEEACRDACIHDEIAALPLQYDTILSEQGRNFSGGQRQRLALARALLRKPALLILDEATSHLDAATEGKVNTALANLRCTQVVIAHRLSTVRHADQIVVLNGGEIAEAGRHDDLIRTGGVYSTLVAAQCMTSPNQPDPQDAVQVCT